MARDVHSAARRLAWEIEHPPVYHRGVSETALHTMAEVVGELEFAEPSRFVKGQEGYAEVLRTVRFLSALVPSFVRDDDISAYIAGIINNPHLSPTMVEDILHGMDEAKGGRIRAGTLRQAGRMLRDGLSQRDVADILGVYRTVIAQLSVFLGVTEAREEYLREAAGEHVEIGGTPEEFAELHDVKLGTARRILQDVRVQLEGVA